MLRRAAGPSCCTVAPLHALPCTVSAEPLLRRLNSLQSTLVFRLLALVLPLHASRHLSGLRPHAVRHWAAVYGVLSRPGCSLSLSSPHPSLLSPFYFLLSRTPVSLFFLSIYLSTYLHLCLFSSLLFFSSHFLLCLFASKPSLFACVYFFPPHDHARVT